MNAAGTTPVRIKFYSALTDSGFVNGQRYYGTLCGQEFSGGSVTHFTVLFSSDKGETVSVGYDSGTWSIEKLAPIYRKVITGETSATGAIAHGLSNRAIIGAIRRDSVGFAFNRGDGYMVVTGTTFQPAISTSVNIDIYYVKDADVKTE